MPFKSTYSELLRVTAFKKIVANALGGKFSKSGVRNQVKLVSIVDDKFYARSEIYKAQQIERFAGFKTHCSNSKNQRIP